MAGPAYRRRRSSWAGRWSAGGAGAVSRAVGRGPIRCGWTAGPAPCSARRPGPPGLVGLGQLGSRRGRRPVPEQPVGLDGEGQAPQGAGRRRGHGRGLRVGGRSARRAPGPPAARSTWTAPPRAARRHRTPRCPRAATRGPAGRRSGPGPPPGASRPPPPSCCRDRRRSATTTMADDQHHDERDQGPRASWTRRRARRRPWWSSWWWWRSWSWCAPGVSWWPPRSWWSAGPWWSWSAEARWSVVVGGRRVGGRGDGHRHRRVGSRRGPGPPTGRRTPVPRHDGRGAAAGGGSPAISRHPVRSRPRAGRCRPPRSTHRAAPRRRRPRCRCVLDAVVAPDRDVDRTAGRELGLHPVQGDQGGAPHHEPVLRAAGVALVAQPLAREHHDPLDLVGAVIVQDGVAPPRPLVGRAPTGPVTTHAPRPGPRCAAAWPGSSAPPRLSGG